MSSASEYDMRFNASAKTICTKRFNFAVHKTDESDDIFTSRFINDDISKDDRESENGTDSGVDGVQQVSGLFRKLEPSVNNNSAHKPLVQEFASDYTAAINSGDARKKTPPQNETAIEPSIEDIDFVDMALARESGDILYTSFDENDSHKEEQKISKHSRNRANSKVKENHRSTFTRPVKFGCFDMLIGVVGLTIFFVDIGTDIELAVNYFKHSMWVNGGVTTGLIVVPSLVTCFLGLNWYIIDYQKEKKVLQELEKIGRKDNAHQTKGYVWFFRFFFTLLQCGPAVRIIEYLICGYKSQWKNLDPRERKRYYKFMLYEDVDTCLLRLFESFLEAAPQLTWQLYIVITLKPKEDVAGSSLRALALLSSWASLAISLVSYHKSLRNSYEEKTKMTIKSLPFYFIWRACETGGRVLCIAMFASAFQLWVFGPLIFHWAFMSGWLIIQKTSFYKNKYLERVFNIICGYVMIFCFLNLREGQTRFRFLLFYFILYAENFLMLALWFRFTEDLGAWFHLWGFIVVLLLFVFHLVFQLLYYTFFHPTKNIKVCLPCNRYVIYSSVCYDIHPKRADSLGDVVENFAVSEIVVEKKTESEYDNEQFEYQNVVMNK